MSYWLRLTEKKKQQQELAATKDRQSSQHLIRDHDGLVTVFRWITVCTSIWFDIHSLSSSLWKKSNFHGNPNIERSITDTINFCSHRWVFPFAKHTLMLLKPVKSMSRLTRAEAKICDEEDRERDMKKRRRRAPVKLSIECVLYCPHIMQEWQGGSCC